MVKFCKKLTESDAFQNFITLVIIFAGVLVGVETYPAVHERFHSILHVLDQLILWTFVGEIILKMVAQGKKPWRYFHDGWNVFDFIVVGVALDTAQQIESHLVTRSYEGFAGPRGGRGRRK